MGEEPGQRVYSPVGVPVGTDGETDLPLGRVVLSGGLPAGVGVSAEE